MARKRPLACTGRPWDLKIRNLREKPVLESWGFTMLRYKARPGRATLKRRRVTVRDRKMAHWPSGRKAAPEARAAPCTCQEGLKQVTQCAERGYQATGASPHRTSHPEVALGPFRRRACPFGVRK